MRVLEEDHRVITADGGAQQTVRVECVRGINNAQTGYLRKERDTGLRVIDRASLKITADGYADDAWRRELVAGAPTQQCQLVANLMKRRPDVVKELHFHDR